MWIQTSIWKSRYHATYGGKKHTDYITSKANSTFGFLCRNINVSNPQIKEQYYMALVHPVLEYSQTVWDPYTAGAVKKPESVQ